MAGSLGELGAIIATIDPVDPATSDVASDYGDMRNFGRVTALCLMGAMDGTMDFVLQQAQDSSGTGVKTLKAATQLSGTDDNKQVVISADQGAMDISGGFTHVRLNADVTGGTANLVCAVVIGWESRYAPTTGLDLASVSEVVEA